MKVTVKIIAALATIFVSATTLADDMDLNVPKNKTWQEECSSCHIAYPPQLLTADNWQRMMSTLDKHFGENAELDAADNKIITAFLKRYAGYGARHSAKSLRISKTSWFTNEHDEVPSSAWKNTAIKSAANCTACHIDAAKGDWSEDGVSMPAGIKKEDDGDDD